MTADWWAGLLLGAILGWASLFALMIWLSGRPRGGPPPDGPGAL